MKNKGKNISAQIRNMHSFINCIGLIDDTLFSLAFAPTLNAEDYTTKGDYPIKKFVDHAAKLAWIEN